VRYRILACDYDGTLARRGRVGDETTRALRALTRTGRKLVLVTGRELDDLRNVFPSIEVFDWVVAENGGFIHQPATGEERALGPPPPQALVSELTSRGVHPLSVGRVIIATWEPHQTVVFETIQRLGLELQVIFNKGAVMVLPPNVNKRSGLEAALDRLGLSVHNCIGVGDAENDHAFLGVCECSVAVANALPALRESVDWVTDYDHGAGVRQVIDALIADDLQGFERRLTRHHVPVGTTAAGEPAAIAPYGSIVLVAGSSGSGKSTATAGILEQLAERGYQLCIVDPEGDHERAPGVVVLGTHEQPPQLEQVVQVLSAPQAHVVVNLLAVSLSDKPDFLLALLARLFELRATTSRPHWIVIDEAHHMLQDGFMPALLTLPQELGGLMLVTVNPERLNRVLLGRVDVVIAVGRDGEATLATFARVLERAPPTIDAAPERPGQALLQHARARRAELVDLTPSRVVNRRHKRKYAQGELGPDKSFYFRGPDGRLNLRAQNLVVFNQLAEGVDEATWLFHLRAGDYSHWIRSAIKDEQLAGAVERVERTFPSDAEESRRAIRKLIDQSYTLPQ
jgi:hydroxymethylpyrimidine pyrophosphatase-like HAD family hydrolase